jgi:hypothetical protein
MAWPQVGRSGGLVAAGLRDERRLAVVTGLRDRGTPRDNSGRFGRSPVVHCGPGVIVAFTWLSEQPAEAHDLWWGRRDRAA